MICLQGTSFAFLGVIIAGGLLLKQQGATPEQILAMIFGCTLVSAIIPLIVSHYPYLFSRIDATGHRYRYCLDRYQSD